MIKCVGNRLVAAGLVSLCGCQVDWMAMDRFLLRPWGPPQESPADRGLVFEDVRIPSSDGNKLAAWFMPAQIGPARATLVVHTGMQGNLARYLNVAERLTEKDLNVLVYDWQGFGASEGVTDFRNMEPDAHAAVDYLRSRPEPSAHKLIHLGLSMGVLPAVGIAADSPDDAIGLILYGPFFPEQLPGIWIGEQTNPLLTPFGNVAGNLWSIILPTFLKPQQHFDRLHTPVLVITPQDDTTIPFEAQLAFFNALPEPKEQFLTFGGHTHSAEEDPAIFDKIESWSGQLPGLPTEESSN